MVSRSLIEKKFIEVLTEKVLTPDRFSDVYGQVAKAIKEQFSHVPEEIKRKKVELNTAESRVHNFVDAHTDT